MLRIVSAMSVDFEQLVALLVDHAALVVGDVVVFEQLLPDVEVARLDAVLRLRDRAVDDRMLDRLAFGHLEPLHDRAQALAAEDAQQRILERQVEARRARDRPGGRRGREAGCRCAATRGARCRRCGGRRRRSPRRAAPAIRSAACRSAAPSRSAASAASSRSLRICGSIAPPSTMSVPRPAMLVAIVMAFGRPACATISASRACCFAFSTSCGRSAFARWPDSISEFSIDVVPTSTGWPRSWQSLMSATIASTFSASVRNTWSFSSLRTIVMCVGITTVSRW